MTYTQQQKDFYFKYGPTLRGFKTSIQKAIETMASIEPINHWDQTDTKTGETIRWAQIKIVPLGEHALKEIICKIGIICKSNNIDFEHQNTPFQVSLYTSSAIRKYSSGDIHSDSGVGSSIKHVSRKSMDFLGHFVEDAKIKVGNEMASGEITVKPKRIEKTRIQGADGVLLAETRLDFKQSTQKIDESIISKCCQSRLDFNDFWVAAICGYHEEAGRWCRPVHYKYLAHCSIVRVFFSNELKAFDDFMEAEIFGDSESVFPDDDNVLTVDCPDDQLIDLLIKKEETKQKKEETKQIKEETKQIEEKTKQYFYLAVAVVVVVLALLFK